MKYIIIVVLGFLWGGWAGTNQLGAVVIGVGCVVIAVTVFAVSNRIKGE